MKRFFILIVIVFIAACQHTPTAGIGYGVPSTLHSVKHAKPGDTYNIKTVLVQIKNLEINLNKHEYHIYQEKTFNNLSVGAKYHFTKTWNWFLVDAGLGFKLTEVDEQNKWLVEKPFLADFSFAIGIQKELNKYGLKLKAMYEFQHLSGIGDDQGLNYDKVYLLFTKTF